jgi:peptidyl-prolyl cis-trans isomerase A (cyclophilin A)
MAPTFNPASISGTGNLYVRISTRLGDMVAELYEKQVPVTVGNFVGLATGGIEWTDPASGQKSNRPFYDGLIFHRIISGFMIQGGCPMGRGTGGPGYKFQDEFDRSLRHTGIGILSMANSGPNTNGSQFFICETATPHLDNRHSVFGKVIAGLDVLRAIAGVKTGPGDRPVEPVVMNKVEVFRSATVPVQ